VYIVPRVVLVRGGVCMLRGSAVPLRFWCGGEWEVARRLLFMGTEGRAGGLCWMFLFRAEGGLVEFGQL